MTSDEIKVFIGALFIYQNFKIIKRNLLRECKGGGRTSRKQAR